ncbi:DUF938 domain-containing protein [Motiliproteus coralliicola]|uniref:DUF938 domain-containing protein n=1 Tax=Motiliproteus coralliicola TaxID=2283196 RepID=A0A369WTT6_9GAMM|nr:DUF938 domain-containing protein [Motiliproteus coralliicola]RDE25011.1 DUF938 domain-containing protein [Motiliproteus coralliicola]
MGSYSEACERNKGVILELLLEQFADRRRVLEIGSGTGQHASYFSRSLSWLEWLPTDHPGQLVDLKDNLGRQPAENLAPPRPLDVAWQDWSIDPVDAVFTANTFHIISWGQLERLFTGVGRVLEDGGKLAVYGPFRYQDGYTSASNAEFDQWLRQRDPASGIRDFEAVDRLAEAQGLQLVLDQSMPANNQLLLWQRRG